MPKIRTPDNTFRKYLFTGNRSDLIRNTGITRRRLYAIIADPGKTSADELAALVREQELTAEELYKVITERG